MLAFLFSLTLFAAEPPRAAVHPLVVRTPEASWAAAAQAEFLSQAARQPLALVSSFAVEDVLDTQPARTCLWRDACLAELARATSAQLALLATINASRTELEVTVRVVAPDGRLLREVARLTQPRKKGQPTGPAFRAAFEALFAELDVATLDLTPPSEEPKEVPAPPALTVVEPQKAAPPVLPPPTPRTNGARLAAITGFSLAALCLAGAGGVVLLSGDDVRALAAQKQGDSIPQAELGRAQSLAARESVTTGLVIGAGALALTSGVLLLVSLDAPKVAVAPTAGGAVLVLGGSLP